MSPALAGGFFAVSTVWVLLVSINFHQSLLPLSSQAVVVCKASHQERGGAPRLSALLPICFLCLQALHLGGLAPGVRGWGIPTEWADLRGQRRAVSQGEDISGGAERSERPAEKQQALQAFRTDVRAQAVTRLMNAEEAKQEMASQSRCPQQRSPPPAPPGKQRETAPAHRSRALAAALARAVGAASKRGAVVGAGVGCRDAPLDCGGSLAAGVRPFCLPLADFFFHSQTQVGASRPGCLDHTGSLPPTRGTKQ